MMGPLDEALRTLMDGVEQYLATLPGPIADKVREELHMLRKLTLDARPPRLCLVGRRGSGKSSLINAIFGEPVAEVGEVQATTGQGRWFTCQGAFGELTFLDTRGLFEGTRPDDATADDPVAEILAACKETYPDAILFLCKAKEVDAHIQADIAQLQDVRDRLSRMHGYTPPVIGVVTQVDELDPVDVATPPYDDPEKQANIEAARALLQQHLTRQGLSAEVFAISAYSRFREGMLVSARHWQVDRLLTHLSERLPNDAQVMLARVAQIKAVQKRTATLIISSATAAASGIGVIPIPMADMPVITSIQIAMVIGIGYVSGRQMDKRSAGEFLAALGLNVGYGFMAREGARALIKLIFPGAGSAISGAVAGAATYALGQAAVAYFIDQVPMGQAKALLEQAQRETAAGSDQP